jgi:hypothetical protein
VLEFELRLDGCDTNINRVDLPSWSSSTGTEYSSTVETDTRVFRFDSCFTSDQTLLLAAELNVDRGDWPIAVALCDLHGEVRSAWTKVATGVIMPQVAHWRGVTLLTCVGMWGAQVGEITPFAESEAVMRDITQLGGPGSAGAHNAAGLGTAFPTIWISEIDDRMLRAQRASLVDLTSSDSWDLQLRFDGIGGSLCWRQGNSESLECAVMYDLPA